MVANNFINVTDIGARQLNGVVSNTLAQNAYYAATNGNVPYRYANKFVNNDTVEVNQKVDIVKTKAQEVANNIDYKKVKKMIITAALSVATVVGLAKFSNKNVNKFWQLGEKLDSAVKNSKVCNKIGSFFNYLKSKNPLSKSELLKDVKNVTAKVNRLQPKAQMAKMSVLGPKGIFSLTPSEVLRNTAKSVGDKGKFTNYLETLLGKDSKICGKTVEEMAEACFSGADLGDSFKFSNELMKTIKNKHGLTSTQKMLSFFDNLKAGKIGEQAFDFAKDVKIKGWVPGSRGNLGESMKKFAIMNGEAAQTTIGRLAQQTPLILGESVSNCVNDRSLFGVALCASYLPATFNEAQDAPKGKKVRTVLSEFISSATSWAVGTAGAGAVVYSAASLKNLQSKGFMANLLKKVGNFASMGLAEGSSKKARFFGAALRLIGVLTLSSKISKPINDTIKKTFGLPTDEQKAQAEEQKQALENAKKIASMPQQAAIQQNFSGFKAFNV